MLSERKRRVRLREKSQGFGLSFVDLVSGGFGAAFFLFLIFASLPVDSPALSAGGGTRFLEVQLAWEKGPQRVEIYLEVDGAAQPIRLSSGSFDVDSETGILTWTGVGPRPFWRTGTTSGFSWFGQGAMVEVGQGARNVVRFRLVKPCGVKLRVGASIHGTSRGLDWLAQETSPNVTAELTMLRSGEEGVRETFEGMLVLTNSVTYASTFSRNGRDVDGVIEIPPPQIEEPGCEP